MICPWQSFSTSTFNLICFWRLVGSLWKLLILRFQKSFVYCIMLTKERQFRQVPTSKSFILEKSLSLWICKRSLPKRSLFGHYYIATHDARSVHFLSKLALRLFTEARFKQFIFIPSYFTVLLTSPEAATKVVLYK